MSLVSEIASAGPSALESGISLALKVSLDVFPAGARVREVSLDEALSVPYKALLEVVSPSPVPRKALDGLLGAKACLAVGRSGARRTVLGTVTGVRTSGIYICNAGGARSLCCRYRLRVEPALALLRETLRTRVFTGMKAPDVVRSVLSDYGIRDSGLDSDPPLVDTDAFDDTQVIWQGLESDLGFVERLLRLYGMNYRFVHSGDEPGEADLYLSRGSLLGCDQDEPDEVRLFAEKPRLFSLETERTVSPERVFVVETPPEGGSESARPCDVSVPFLPFQTGRNRGARYEALEAARIRSSLAATLKASHESWTAGADDLAMVPGRILSVPDAFGEGGDESRLLVTGASLFCRAAWPSDVALPPALASEAAESYKQTVRGVDAPSGDGPAGNLAGLAGNDAPSRVSSFFAASGEGFPTLLRGRIGKGLADPSVDASDGPRLLSASIPGVEGDAAAELAFSPSANRTGPLVMPHPGDDVLVARSQGGLRIVGSLSRPYAPESAISALARSSREGFGSPDSGSGSDGVTLLVSNSSKPSAASVIEQLFAGTLFTTVGARAWSRSNDTYLTARENHETKLNKLLSDFLTARDKYSSILLDRDAGDSFPDSVESARKDYENAAGDLLGAAGDLAADLGGAVDENSARDAADEARTGSLIESQEDANG